MLQDELNSSSEVHEAWDSWRVCVFHQPAHTNPSISCYQLLRHPYLPGRPLLPADGPLPWLLVPDCCCSAVLLVLVARFLTELIPGLAACWLQQLIGCAVGQSNNWPAYRTGTAAMMLSQ